MTGPAPLVLTDEWIERMLVERAGSVAPIDLVSDIVASIGATSQRTSGRRSPAGPLPSRGRLLLVAATLTLAGGAGALIGSGALSTLPLPSPAPIPSGQSTPSPSSEATRTPSLAPVDSPPTGAFAAFPGLFGDVDPYAFRLVSETVGWVAMANLNGDTPAALYRTEDAGRSWIQVRLPESGTFRGGRGGVALVDADTVVAAFGDGSTLRIVATHDRGASWTTATIDDPIVGTGASPALWFSSPNSGTATFQDGDLRPRLRAFATTDGGVTWGPGRDGTVPGKRFPFKLGLEVRPGPHGFLSVDSSGAPERLMASSDGGATWRSLSLPLSPDHTVEPIGTPWIGDDGHIAFAARVDSVGRFDGLYNSVDGGQTWETIRIWPIGTLEDAQPWSATEWMVMGHDQTSFWSTTDGGATWRDVTRESTASSVGSFSFGSPDVGWSLYGCFFVREHPDPYCDDASVASVLLVTWDGGRTWTPIGE